MPSRFPGMDPFLEGQLWADFHVHLIAAIRVALVPALRPRYVAVVEERIYLEHSVEAPPPGRSGVSAPGAAASTAVVNPPVAVPLLMPERVRERFIEIRMRDSSEVVAVIEVLSPTNKKSGSDGRREYLKKRELVLQSTAHLIEIDLLRGGKRLPMGRALPPGDYYIIVSRAMRRPMADVWPFTLRQPLPVIPVPLAGEDPDVHLDLQAVFSQVYDQAGYDYALRSDRPVDPPLATDEEAWVLQVLLGDG